MMNSTADDFDFPPNPFRSTPVSSGMQNQQQSSQQQQQQQQDFFIAPPVDPSMQLQYHNDPLSHNSSSSNNNNNNNNSARGLPTNAGQARTSASLGGMMDDRNDSQQIPVAAASAPTSSRISACISCTRMDTYRNYFDMDTIDIQTRIKNSILMCYMPDKFRVAVIGAERNDATKGPDLYGPLWITMTLVFLLALTSNMSAYFRTDPAEFEYDISHLIRAMTVCFSFSFGAPVLFWVLTQCMAMQAMLMVDWICLYGYAMVIYLPTTLLCLVPIHAWIWMCLLAATCASGLLVVRNVAAPLLSSDTAGNKAGPLLMAIMGTHLIFFVVLKLAFYH